MSQYEITHKCGHTETLNITGTNVHGEREARAKREAERDCRACYVANRDAVAAVANAHLPALTGSPRQVAWAETIRAATASNLNATKDKILATAAGTPREQEGHRLCAAIDTAMINKTSAAWWIDRGDPVAAADLKAEARSATPKTALT